MNIIKRVTVAVASVLVLAGAFSAPAAASQPFAPTNVTAAAAKTPPALLPWGAKAVGKFTAAAPAATTGERTAPKGRTTNTASKALTSTCGVSPLPACFYYNIGSEQPPTVQTQVFSTTVIGKPTLGANNFHTLMEISAAKEGAQSNMVEIGWTHDRVVNGSCTPSPACKNEPYLFGYWWKNGAGQGYNNVAGWTDNTSNPINLGSKLTNGDIKKFGIAFSNGAWWLAYDNAWVGDYDETNWTGSTLGGTGHTTPVVGGFHTFAYYQTFAELASNNDTPTTDCSQMGNGAIATNQNTITPNASRWSGTVLVDSAGLQTNGNLWFHNSSNVPSAQWDVSPLVGATKTAWMGGPGGTGTAGGACS